MENLNQTSNAEFKNIIEECLLVHHTDMFFKLLFREIIYKEYEKNGVIFQADLNDVLKKYLKLTSYVLKEAAGVITNFYAMVTDQDRSLYKLLYNDALEYASAYSKVIATYVIYREDIQHIILNELGDDNLYGGFYSFCMYRGYEIALRHLKNIDDKNYFSEELVHTSKSIVIKVSPTPYGFLMKKKLVELIMQSKLHEVLNDHLKEDGIIAVQNVRLEEIFQTNLIYKTTVLDGLFYYKRRTIDLQYAPFGEQDRIDPFRALIMQGQINLTFAAVPLANGDQQLMEKALELHSPQVLKSNPISNQLKTRLENAFDSFKKNTINPVVIAKLHNPAWLDVVYLISKDPNSDMFYGIRESEINNKKEIMGIPLNNLLDIGLEEISISSFRARPYIENGIKEL